MECPSEEKGKIKNFDIALPTVLKDEDFQENEALDLAADTTEVFPAWPQFSEIDENAEYHVEDCSLPFAAVTDYEHGKPQFAQMNVVLPIHEDDWELTSGDKNVEQVVTPVERSDAPTTTLLTPFTAEERSSFYENVLLKHDETYTDQFMADAHVYNDHFKSLLLNYRQARLRLYKARKKFDSQTEVISNAFCEVFQTGEGEVVAEGYCQDHRKVKFVHMFETCTFDHEAHDRLSSSLSAARQIASDDVMLCSYTSTVNRLRCEQYLYELTEKHTMHRDRLKRSTENPQCGDVSILLQLVGETIAELKFACNYLFMFVRQARDAEEAEDRFWKDVERWLSLVLLQLLQAAGGDNASGRHFSEEMFVVNHVIRSPPGIHRWFLPGLVQIAGPLGFGLQDKTSLDHSLYLLHLVLSFPKGRDDFLEHFCLDEHRSPNQSSSEWTLIDEDGEEVDSLQGGNKGVFPLESDLVALFCQVPIKSIVSSALGVSIAADEVCYYGDRQITSRDLMNTFVVLDALCQILGEGLQALCRPKYKQLVRRIAQTLRNVVVLASEHWLFYQQQDGSFCDEIYGLDRLQLEFDELCKRCVSRLLAVTRLGVYQFIADLPFETVSSRAAETLYVLMNVPETSREEVNELVGTAYAHQEWVEFIQDPDTKLAFEEQLSSMPTNEVVYLLTAFANLAQSRRSDEEHLVKNISVDIFKISFVYKGTMDVCSKTGRELLSSLANCHPFIISTLLQFVQQNFGSIAGVIYAFNDLPFSLWQPKEQDIAVLSVYLQDHAVTSVQFRLAKIVIQGLNFQYNESGELFIARSVHCQIALIICETNVRLEMERQRSGVVMKSFDHVSRIASVSRFSSQSAYEQFASWSWRILLQLKLHKRQLLVPVLNAGLHRWREEASTVHDLHRDIVLVPLLQAVHDKNCMASYVALLMTQFGHSVDAFLNEGMELLHHLTASSCADAVAMCLHCVVCVFQAANINLAENQRFKDILVLILRSDDGSLLSSITGKLLQSETRSKHVGSMMLALHGQVLEGSNAEEKTTVFSYWLRMLLALPEWYKLVNCHAILDYIFMHARSIGGNVLLECRTLLYGNYVDMMLHVGNHQPSQPHSSVVSSLLHLVSGNNRSSVPSFINSFESVQYIYFAFEVLDTETRFEDDTKLWTTTISFLQSEARLSIEGALKKASSKLKLDYVAQPLHLTLYRWGELASQTPPDHPLVQAIWLKFFFRFIFLPPDGGSSLGCRFFAPVNLLPAFNKLRTSSQNASDYHRTVISNRNYEPDAKSHHERCVQLFQSFKLWLEEPKIHEANLYLPSLPPQYECEMLGRVRTGDRELCLEAIRVPRIAKEVNKITLVWDSSLQSEEGKRSKPANRAEAEVDTDERLIKLTQLLKQFEAPKPLPDLASIGSLAPPVAIGDVAQIWKYDTVLHMVDQDLKILASFSEDFVNLQNLHWRIDSEYLQLLPSLYYMKDKELTRGVECQSGFASTHKCAGPAQIRLRFKEKAERQSTASSMKTNRKTCEKVLQKFLSEDTSSDLCFASLHLENVVRALEFNASNLQYTDDVHRSAREAGTNLFYLLASMYSKERKSCQLTKHLLSTCVEKLGETFLSLSVNQAPRILDEVLANPDSASLLSPYFCPGSLHSSVPHQSQAEYITMYRRVVEVVSSFVHSDSDVLFVLLTKFELSDWMNQTVPPSHERLDLLQYIFNGITAEYKNKLQEKREKVSESKDGLEPNTIRPRLPHAAIHQIYLEHFKAVLDFRFPDLFLAALKRLLEDSSHEVVPVDVWEAFLSVCFHDVADAGAEQRGEGEASSAQLFYSSQIDWNTVMQTIDYVAEYHRQFLLAAPLEEKTRKSLYECWTPYVESLSAFFSRLSRSAIVLTHHCHVPTSSPGPDQFGSFHWSPLESVFLLYYAWLFPSSTSQTGEVAWPWQDSEAALSKFMTDSFAQVLFEFCQGYGAASQLDKVVVASRLSYIWTQYAQAVFQVQSVVPVGVFVSYHEMFERLPWNLFLPHTQCLMEMVAICDGNVDVLMDFLCFVVPQISWSSVLELCQLEDADASETEQGEMLYRLLYILFALGAGPERLQNNAPLEGLFDEVALLPLHLVPVDMVGKLSGLVCDRYAWTSVLLRTRTKQMKRDQRYVAVRLLKIVCRLPLVGGENSQGSSATHPASASQTDCLKQEMFISCIGQLLQKSAFESFAHVSELAQRLHDFIETTMESVESTPRGVSVDHLPILLGALFAYLNIIPAACQETALRSMVSVISRPSTCEQALQSLVEQTAHAVSTCQNCTFLKSRALSQDTLLGCVSAAASILTPQHTSQILEASIESYLMRRVADQLQTEETMGDRSTEVTKGWNYVLSALNAVKNRESIYSECVKSSCLLTLHALTMNEMNLPGFYDRKDGLSVDLLSDAVKVEIDKKMSLLITYLSSFAPTKESEAKVLLLIDQIICGSSILWQSPIVTHYICDQVGKFLSVLDAFSMDKVKSGILGSIGISRQSSLSPEFRLATRSISCFLKHWYARFNPESADAVSTAVDAFDAYKKLPTSNKLYVPLASVISEVGGLMGQSLNLGDYRKILSVFIRRYYSSRVYCVHLLPIT